MRTICFVVGARPNFMKSAPVYRALHAEAPDLGRILVHTGQHYDEDMSSVFIRELGLPQPDVFLGVAGLHFRGVELRRVPARLPRAMGVGRHPRRRGHLALLPCGPGRLRLPRDQAGHRASPFWVSLRVGKRR